ALGDAGGARGQAERRQRAGGTCRCSPVPVRPDPAGRRRPYAAPGGYPACHRSGQEADVCRYCAWHSRL
ncbi:hypothetical protein LPJ73_001583, partial [Coemansia sp. RSA 2703]